MRGFKEALWFRSSHHILAPLVWLACCAPSLVVRRSNAYFVAMGKRWSSLTVMALGRNPERETHQLCVADVQEIVFVFDR